MSKKRSWEDPEEMISVDDALIQILSHFSALESIQVPIVDATEMVLAEDIIAMSDIPPFQNSAMDGYAIRARDTAGASPDSPAYLQIVDTVAAGSVGSVPVGERQAVRIMTGAPMPEGADTVVRFEETDEVARATGEYPDVSRTTVGIHRPMKVHENVREPGEDIRSGTVVLRREQRLRPAEVGVLASLNYATVAVHRRPKVGILSTGDEVIDIGPELQPGQIRNSNSYTIASMVHRYGGSPILLGVAKDSTGDLVNRLNSAEKPDMYVTSGGVSLGDYDMVKDVLQSEGQVEIWQVRMKPGKPLAFGLIGSTPLLGLPGNPAAALVSFEQFGRPAILKMLGRTEVTIPEVTATLTESLANNGRRRHFVRGILTESEQGFQVRSTGIQGAAILSAVVQSNCFLIVPETCDYIEAGSQVQVQLIDQQYA